MFANLPDLKKKPFGSDFASANVDKHIFNIVNGVTAFEKDKRQCLGIQGKLSLIFAEYRSPVNSDTSMQETSS